MPELPEVETIVRQLRPVIVGKIIADFWSERENTVFTDSVSDFEEKVRGQQISDVSRRAKMIVLHLDNDKAIGIHLKMSGALKVIGDGTDFDSKYTRAYFTFKDGDKLIFNDIRRFGKIHFIENYAKWQRKYGIEPLSNDGFTEANLVSIFKDLKAPIKSVLLNQELIAGIGNIYADEILWSSQIHPAKPANTLNRQDIERIFINTPHILQTAINANGSTFRNYRDLHGLKGGYMDMANCYGLTGEPCKRNDGGIITRIVLRTRATHFCPICQK